MYTICNNNSGGKNLDTLLIKAMGKINLSLDVLRKRDDGYHEVRMIMQTVNLYDELLISQNQNGKIDINCDKKWLPCNENNLIYKAAKLLLDSANENRGVKIELTKRIPVAAGMAGGSSDAAATLVGLNKFFNLGYSLEELRILGVKIGADVPYCIMGGTALSEGIGEILTPLKGAPECFVVLAKPDINVSTKYVYENLHADTLKVHPDIDGMVESIKRGDLRLIADKMGNVLETVTIQKYPIISKMKESLLKDGAMNSLMSGSGPTVFGLFTDKKKATIALNHLKKQGFVKQGFVTTLTSNTCTMG